MSARLIVSAVLAICGMASAAPPDPTLLNRAHERVDSLVSQTTEEYDTLRWSQYRGGRGKLKVRRLIVDTPRSQAAAPERQAELVVVTGQLEWGHRCEIQCGTLVGDHGCRWDAGPSSPTDSQAIGFVKPDGTLVAPGSLISGGFIWMGDSHASGWAKTFESDVASLTRSGFVTRLGVNNWQNGDTVYVPGAAPGEPREKRQIAFTGAGWSFVEASANGGFAPKPLASDHRFANGRFPPLQNATRNLKIYRVGSGHKPHHMLMAGDAGPLTFGWVELDGLEHGDAAVPGRDGMYSGHVHRVIGPETPCPTTGEPVCFCGRGAGWNITGLVVHDSQDGVLDEHGFVNHGARVYLSQCIVVGAKGSSFFMENGLEEGTLKQCVSVDAGGVPGEPIAATQAGEGRSLEDFGVNGFGFWLHGGKVKLIGCESWGAKTAAVESYGKGLRETGDSGAMMKEAVTIKGLVAANSRDGVRIKYHDGGPKDLIENCQFLNCDRCINTHYVFAGSVYRKNENWGCRAVFDKTPNSGDKHEFVENTSHGHALGFWYCEKGAALTTTTYRGNRFDSYKAGVVDIRLPPVTSGTFVNENNLKADGSPATVTGP